MTAYAIKNKNKVHLRTPLLVNVDMSRDRYISGLTKPAKKNYKASQKRGYDFENSFYDEGLIAAAMVMWSEQIGGQWIFGPEYFTNLKENGWLEIFVGHAPGEQTAAILPMERFRDLMYAQPVMYDKTKNPHIAKFMWFSMIKWACEDPLINWIDLGGGFHGSYRDFLMNRRDPNFAYKWQFVSKGVKMYPQNQKPYYVQRCTCGWKQLVFDRVPCYNCGA